MLEKKKISEEELAEITDAYFSGKAWDLFPEVVLPNHSGRPDFVATKQQLVAVIECKLSFSYTVLEQLVRWRTDWDKWVNSKYSKKDENPRGIPHLLIAVVQGNPRMTDLKKQILEQHRIGLLSVEYVSNFPLRSQKEGIFDLHGYGVYQGCSWRITEHVTPKIQSGSRKTAQYIRKHLYDDMKVANAGASGKKGGYVTPFKRTMNRVKAILDQGGEWHIDHIIRELNSKHGGHHYSTDSSAKASISKFIPELNVGLKPYDMRPVFKSIETDLAS